MGPLASTPGLVDEYLIAVHPAVITFPVVKAKLDRMHREEPTLTVADLAGYPGPALVVVLPVLSRDGHTSRAVRSAADHGGCGVDPGRC